MPSKTDWILAPIDVEHRPEVALNWAVAVARLFNRNLDLYFASPHRRDEPLLREELHALTLKARQALADRPHLQVERTFDPAWEPVQGIIDHVRAEGHTLIVLLTRERSALSRLLEGSVTDEVIQGSPCAVLALPDDIPVPSGPMCSRILAATDLSSAEPMRQAATWSRLCGAQVTYLYVVDASRAHLPDLATAYDPQQAFDATVEGARRAVNTWLHEHPEVRPSTPYEVEVRVGDSAREISRDARERDFDMVITGYHHRGFLQRFLLGSVAEEVLHRADLPVLIVPADEPPAG